MLVNSDMGARPHQESKLSEGFTVRLNTPTLIVCSDTVKLTAQFVAQNGKQFEAALMQKEDRNHHFDFLKPQRPLNLYYTKLVEQYTRVCVLLENRPVGSLQCHGNHGQAARR